MWQGWAAAAVMTSFESVYASLSQLTENPSVQDDLDRAVKSAQAAWTRARKAKHLQQAAADRTVRVRVRQSYEAARSAAATIRRGPEIERRRRRRRPVLIAGAALAGTLAVALYPDLRTQFSRPSSADQA